MTIYNKYMTLANSLVNFKNKRILEVGGCTPSDTIIQFSPRTWTSVDLNISAVEKSNKDNQKSNFIQYVYGDICDYMNYEKFDIIYSINCFEHINNLEKAIDNLHNLLKNNGYVFTIFGPIWSSHVGHHLSINSKHGNINFANNILTPWIHLMGKNYVYEEIKRNYDKHIAQKAINYIYYSNDLNRLHLNDYKHILKRSKFNLLSNLYNRKGPINHKYSRVKEILWVLKKGNITKLEQISFYSKLFYNLAHIKLRL